MTMQKKIHQNLKNSKPIGFYIEVPFTFKCFHDNNMPSGAIKHRQSTKSERHLTTKTFYFFLLSSFGWGNPTFSWQFSHKTAAFYT